MNDRLVSSGNTAVDHKLGGLKLVVCWAGVDSAGWMGKISPSGYYWATTEEITGAWFLAGAVPHDFVH